MNEAPFNPIGWLLDRVGPRLTAPLNESKAIVPIGQDPALAGFYGEASRQDGTNFRTNQVTLAEFQDNMAVNEASVLAISATWACVNLLAGTIASLPLMVFRGNGADRKVAFDHPLYGVLHDSPNADQTALDFWEFICACLELRGDGFAEIRRRADKSVISLEPPIPPQMVQVRRSKSGALEYTITQGGKSRTVSQSNILHIRGFGGSPLGGLSTLAFGRRVFGSAMAIDSAATSTFRNGVRTSGAFVSDHVLDKEQMETVEKRVSEKYQGAVNAGRPLVLNAGMKWQNISISPEDAQMLESRAFGIEEICRMFGVPPHMVGHTQKVTSWGTGLEQQTLGFQKFTLRRRLKRIEQALEKQLLTAADKAQGISIEFNLEGLLRGDSASRATFYQAALGDTQKPGWMVRNEVRRLENLPPIAGWDEPVELISGKPQGEDDAAQGL